MTNPHDTGYRPTLAEYIANGYLTDRQAVTVADGVADYRRALDALLLATELAARDGVGLDHAHLDAFTEATEDRQRVADRLAAEGVDQAVIWFALDTNPRRVETVPGGQGAVL